MVMLKADGWNSTRTNYVQIMRKSCVKKHFYKKKMLIILQGVSCQLSIDNQTGSWGKYLF